MKPITIIGSEDTPGVILDKDNNIFEISGRSLPEDAAEFYKPILNWMNDYKKEHSNKTEFVVKLEYFNTSSSKLILDILTRLEGIPGSSIVWCYCADDEDMQEAGEEFSELVTVPFE